MTDSFRAVQLQQSNHQLFISSSRCNIFRMIISAIPMNPLINHDVARWIAMWAFQTHPNIISSWYHADLYHYHPLSSIIIHSPVLSRYICIYSLPISCFFVGWSNHFETPRTNKRCKTAPHITTFDAVGAGAAGAGGPLPLPAAAVARALRASRPEGNQKVGGFDGI